MLIDLRWPVTVSAVATVCLSALAGCSQSPPPTAQAPAAQTAAPTPPLRGLGVGTHLSRLPNWDVDKVLPLLQQMGVSVVRDDLAWASVEKTKGVYALEAKDQHWIDAIAGSGIKLVLVLCYANKVYDNPLDPQAFAQYCEWVAQHLKGKVAVYEVWNEPVNFQFFKQYGGERSGRGDALWVAKYGELVAAASAAIRAADPQAVIMHNIGGAPWVYSLRKSSQDYALVDGIDIHAYPKRFPPETCTWGGPDVEKRDGVSIADDEHSLVSLLKAQSQMAPQQYLGHTMQCLVGEYGYSTYTPLKAGYFGGYTPQAQAEYLVRAVALSLTCGIKALCIYDFVDDGNKPNDAECNFGLVFDQTRGYQPKPAFFALQRLARQLGPDWQYLQTPPAGFQLTSPLPSSGDPASLSPLAATWVKIDGPQVYWFRVGEDYVSILWRAGWRHEDFNPARGSITWQGAPAGLTVQIQDLISGETLTPKLTRSGNTLTVSDLPVGSSAIAVRWIGAAPASSNH
jgi:hypothetical protein